MELFCNFIKKHNTSEIYDKKTGIRSIKPKTESHFLSEILIANNEIGLLPYSLNRIL